MTRSLMILSATVAIALHGCTPPPAEPEVDPKSVKVPGNPIGDRQLGMSAPSGSAPAEAAPAEAAPAADPTDVSARAPKAGEEVGILETGSGKIIVMFFPDVAPKMVARFKECISKGIYNGTYFHRVIPGFMIQGGDPNTKNADRADDGSGGYGSFLPSEFSSIKHVRGILSTARTSDPNSAQSQFFIMHDTYPSLDNQYTVFGKVVTGLEVVDKIVNQPRDQNDNPNDHKAVTIKKASLAKWPVK